MKWVEPKAVDVPRDLSAAVGGHPLIAQSLVRRGFVSPESALAFLDPDRYRPSSPLELPDMEAAVARLQEAIAHGERILVWGDFDVDGLTATALLVEALRELGADVDWYIPDRQSESHGLHWPSLQPYLGRGVQVLLTCDTGTSAHEEILLARSAGLDVLVTDHHDLPPNMPDALAIVNPNRLSQQHPLYHLSGVGVAYELAEALSAHERGLDLVALGLVADVVPQYGEVRYLLQRGLRALQRSDRLGLRALLEAADLEPSGLDEDHIAFALAPRLNALGRLADASAGVELFLAADPVRARAIAAEAEALNVRRQFLSRQVTQAAQAQIERDPSIASGPVLVLSHPRWPGPVLGIAASRLAERYNRPTVLIAAPPGEQARGSARSVPGVDIRAALAAQSQLFRSFGGHPMAAGFSMPSERVDDLRRGLLRFARDTIGETVPERELQLEAYLSLSDLSMELYDELARLAPFGAGNPALILAARSLRVTAHRTIGRTAEHRRLEVQDAQGCAQPAVWWQSKDLPVPDGLFDLAYVLRAHEFRGERSLQLEWIDARWVEKPVVEVAQPPAVAAVADYRLQAQPLPTLHALWEDGMVLWAELEAPPGFSSRNRLELEKSPALVVWTTPPGPKVWQDALLRVRPRELYLFAAEPDLDEIGTFLRRLAGLVKHALGAYGGQLGWEQLAAAVAQRIETVQAGLSWLMARGQVSLVSSVADGILLEAGGPRSGRAEMAARRELQELLRETAAYRAYFRGAPLESLIAGSA
jgi:single-stranded-DNA-specific exonuclease